VDPVTRLEGRHPLFNDEDFGEFVKTLNSMSMESIQIFVHSDMAEYEEYE
jgi:hypothetical protein